MRGVKRRYWIILALTLLIASQVHAQSALTTDGIACKTISYTRDFTKLAVAKDMSSMRSYMDSGKCILLDENM